MKDESGKMNRRMLGRFGSRKRSGFPFAQFPVPKTIGISLRSISHFKFRISNFVFGVLTLFGLGSCNTDFTPKPRGYIRMDLPEKEYQPIETDCPFSFENAVYSDFVPDLRAQSEPCWFNIEYPQFKATLHFSYKPIHNNLSSFLEESRTLTNKHISKASAIDENLIIRPDARVYGMLYIIEGAEAASPLQLYLTDSTDHFLRGALYFNVSPNNDSLAPVIELLRDDVLHIIETLSWNH